ncbi:MAG: hypothetical protein P9L99_11080 [Candidatus Lernaella stagnicola]|nr:hypothetical protein [Candidatus Lernaella stagnicola]
MKRTLITILLALCLACGVAAGKELHPLGGDISPEKIQAKVGRVLVFELSIEPRTAFERAGLTVETTKGLTLLKGVRSEVLSNLKPGTKTHFTFQVRVVEPGPQELQVTLSVLDLPNEEIISRLYLAQVNPKPLPSYPTKTDDHGNEFIEIEVD